MDEAPDMAAIAALGRLEVMRERLHDALREAAFSFVAAQREEESTRGCLVSYDAVPTAENTLSPLIAVSHAGEEGEKSAEAACASTWTLTEKEGERKPRQPSRQSLKSVLKGEGEQETRVDSAPAAVDPIYYLSDHPSSALRDCQAAYRWVLQCVVDVANAQQHALRTAEVYAGTAPHASQDVC